MLVGSVSIPSHAAEPDYIDDSVISIDTYNAFSKMYYHRESDNSDVNVNVIKGRKTIDNVNYISFHTDNKAYYEQNQIRFFYLSNPVNLKADTHYNLNMHALCDSAFWARFRVNFRVFARVSSSSGINDILLYDSLCYYPSRPNSSSLSLKDFDFKLDSKELPSNYKLQLLFICETGSIINDASIQLLPNFYISDKITVTDLDSNAKWYVRIINAIKAIPDKLRGFFAELGNKITALGDKIGGFFTDLKNNIVEQFRNLKQWFVQLGDRIQGFFTDLKNKIVEQINRVGQWFIDLKDNIIQGLKDLFIPSSTYFDDYKTRWETWANAHLGFIMDIGTFFTGFLNTILEFFKINTYKFTLPRAAFTIHGKEVVLWNETVVDMAYILNIKGLDFLYNAYNVIAFALFCFALQKYMVDTAEAIIEDKKGEG